MLEQENQDSMLRVLSDYATENIQLKLLNAKQEDLLKNKDLKIAELEEATKSDEEGE